MRAEKSHRIPSVALALTFGLVSAGVASCDAGWVLEQVKKNAGTHGSDHGGGGKPDAPTCQDQVLGDATTCKDVGSLKQDAWNACDKQGLVLNAYTPEKECGDGGFLYVRTTCCPKPEPTPP